MMHPNRTFQIKDMVSINELVDALMQYTWTLCTAFRLTVDEAAPPLVFLNDSFSEDGAQEYAVVRDGRQIESITFSWCSPAQATNYIAHLVQGGGADYGPLTPRVEPPDTHRCHLCR